MATTQVKFHSVDKSKYDSISDKDAGGLYFISDNGEIRKGAAHVSGTRVFTATDATGTTAVADLTIYIGNTAITTSGAE